MSFNLCLYDRPVAWAILIIHCGQGESSCRSNGHIERILQYRMRRSGDGIEANSISVQNNQSIALFHFTIIHASPISSLLLLPFLLRYILPPIHGQHHLSNTRNTLPFPQCNLRSIWGTLCTIYENRPQVLYVATYQIDPAFERRTMRATIFLTKAHGSLSAPSFVALRCSFAAW